jgi:hypothetical protein
VVRGGASGRTEASSRRKIHGLPNISIFRRFFKAIEYFREFQIASGSNHTTALKPGAAKASAIRGAARGRQPIEYLNYFGAREFIQ